MSVITAENRSVLPMETKNICERSDMEETGTHNTKVSDSGYSNSCSNSQSQRSGSGSSKSRHSGSSSGSSGYCGHPSTLGSSNDSFQQPSTMKRKEYKKKKLKALAGELLNDTGGVVTPGVSGPLETIPAVATSPLANIEPAFLTTGSSQTIEKENIQLNPLSHPTLSLKCIKKLKGKDLITGEEMCEGTPSTDGIDSKDDTKVVADNTHKSSSRKEEFSAVVSMQEGVVLYTTNSVTDVLGYPKDMWLGRSLINFVHPKDRKAFNSHITSGIATPLNDRRTQNVQNAAICKRNSFYCCLRQYRGLKSSGFGVTNKKVSYIPCQLTLAFREISNKNPVLDNNEIENDVDIKEFPGDQNVVRAIWLIVTARLVHSVYKIPDEVCASSTYTTRHSTSMLFTHVDSEIVTYFGYLPQDMIGRSVFEFYHPEDLPYLKEVYENVFKDKGQPFRSKPYRFRTQNGGFAVIETEWSSFVNPWTKKIEFVTGQHRVIKGPPNPDVTTPDIEPEPLQISEEVLKESNMIQEEIINILNESAEAQDSTKYQMTKYCKELLTFIENVLDEDKTNSDKSESKPVSLSITDRDSVMLGEISPHHEYYDSKSSSETPPSYTQLNYNDNIQRFFESKPKTTLSDESGDSKTSLCNERNTQSSGGDEEGKISPPVDSSCGGSHNRNSGLNNESGGSSDLSFGNSSGGAAGVGNGVGVGGGTGGGEAVNGGGGGTGNINNNNTTTSGPVNKYRTPHLTEELLSKHNENMEKKLVQRHRERSKSDRENKLKDGRHKKNYDKILDEQNAHGVKRSGSHSWEGEPFKSIKQTHAGNEPVPESNTTSAPKIFSLPQTTATYTKPVVTSSANINLWPPFSVTVTPLHSTQPCTTHLSYSATPLHNTMLPLYYVPPEIQPPPNRTSNNNNSNNTNINSNNSNERGPPTLSPYIQPSPGTYMAGQFQYYLSSMMYHPVPTPLPMFGVPPVMYSPITMLPAPLLSTQPMKPQAQQPQNNYNNTNTPSQMDQSGDNKKAQRPSSQATSVKAEPGSAFCSIASNSLQQAMSETSKREGKSLGIPSPQSLVSQDSPEKTKADLELDVNSNDLLDTSLHNDSSSYYSSFYSFMKADEKSDESMKSLTENDSSVETNTDNNQEDLWRRNFNNNDNDAREQMQKPVRKVPPWLENVSLTPDLLFRYQVSEKNLSDVLEADLKILTEIQQPLMVNDQLCQLYLDLEPFHQADCALETSMGFTSSSGTSSGEGDDHPLSSIKTKKKYRSMEYHDKMVMLFEENAPMPSPLSHSNGPALLSIQTT